MLDPQILKAEELDRIRSRLIEQLDGISESVVTLLDWAKSQMDGEDMKVIQVDVFAMALEMQQLYELPAQQKNVRIENKVPRNSHVMADINQLRAIMRNLVSNALKFTKEEGEIVISVHQAEHRQLVVAVADNGQGMTKEKSQSLFTSQVVSTPGTAGEKGVGLGLMLVKDFVEKNKGRIWVESEEGKGSTFFFSLPEG
jgi:signal transduction histidine kinase